MIKHTIGSIVARGVSKDVLKFDGMKNIKNYGIVRDTREENEIEVVNVEWYVDHPSMSTYNDNDYNYFPAALYRTIVECMEMMDVDFLALRDIFYQTNDGEWDYASYHSAFCSECNMRPCLREERAEDIYYIFTHIRMQFCSMRRKRFMAYKEFVRMVHGVLGTGIRLEIPGCCVNAIRQEFPRENDGDAAYTGFRPSTNN